MVVIEAVKYFWREWYARITLPDGRTWHSEPWNTQEAALIHVRALEKNRHGFMRPDYRTKRWR